MDVHLFEDGASFAREAAGYFLADPFSSNVIAVQVDSVLKAIRNAGPQDRYWTVVEAGRAVGIAMHTPPQNVFLARMSASAAAALAQSLAATWQRLPGATGEVQSLRAFVEEWTRLTGQRSSLDVTMRMYRLAELDVPEGVEGDGRPAVEGDIAVVADWLQAFHDEAQRHAPNQALTALARQRVQAGQFRLWEDHQEPVSLAGFSPPAAGVSRVGPVYTPPPRRRRGYGAAVTAEATGAAIEAGAEHVVLYADLANPTSNAIYQAIGYRADHDAEERSFHP